MNDSCRTSKVTTYKRWYHSMFSSNLSSSLVRICDAHNYSYETAAEICCLSSRYFGSIARGQTSPTVTTLEKICTGFEKTPNDLLGFLSTDEELSYRMPMRVNKVRRLPFLQGSTTTYPICPRCGISIEREYQSFCDNCGQRLDWDSFQYAIIIAGV